MACLCCGLTNLVRRLLNRAMDVPGRVLLDTNVVNFMLDWGEVIYDGGKVPESVPEHEVADILALRGIFLTGQRACWQTAISPATYREIVATTDAKRRKALTGWFGEFWVYWRVTFEEESLSDSHARELARKLNAAYLLDALPDASDRELVAHAIAYGCDAFCTRDRRTIVRYRDKLRLVPVRIFTPAEWWTQLAPHAGLWV